jgi:hypothetical protein
VSLPLWIRFKPGGCPNCKRLVRVIVAEAIRLGVFNFLDHGKKSIANLLHNITLLNITGTYMAGLYLYNIVQCPMEAFHGRQSLLHNFAAAGMLGYIGVANGRLGIPFINPYTLHGSPLKPEIVAFGVYGSMAAAFAAFGGKQI